MGAEPFERIMVLLRVGTAGYLVGAVAWSLFWFAIAANYVGMWWVYWPYVGFFAVSLSLVMVGVGCLGLDRLYGGALPVITGAVDMIAAVLFSLVGFFMLPSTPSYVWRWHLEFASIFGYMFLIASLILWGTLITDVARSNHRRLRTAIGYTSFVSVISICFTFLIIWFNPPIAPTILTQPYVLTQVLSAVLLHRISSDIRARALSC